MKSPFVFNFLFSNTIMKRFEIGLFFLRVALSSCLKSSSVIEEAVRLANTNFIHHSVTSVVWWHSDYEEITYFLRKFSGTVALTAIKKNNAEEILETYQIIGFKQTVFFATTVEEFAHFLTSLKLTIVVPIRIILVVTKHIKYSDMSDFTKTAWNNDVADLIIVSIKENNVVLSTYFPYRKGVCGDTTPVKIEPAEETGFSKKFSNFYGCVIRVVLVHLPPYCKLTFENDTITSLSGLDGNVFSILIEKLNASLDFVIPQDHSTVGSYINGTATGAFAEVVYRRADFFSPAVIINYLRYPVAQISHVIETIDVYWFGPKRLEVHEWKRVLQPLMTDISPAIISSFILFIIVMKIVKRYGLHRVQYRHVLFQSFRIFLGQEVQFESKSWLVNSIFIMWISFCMVVRIVYQGDLVNEMQKTILEDPLTSFENAVRMVNGYGGSEAFREYYRGTIFFDDYQVLKISTIPMIIKEVADGKRFLIATDKLLTFEITHGLQMIKEPVTHAPVGFFMRPGWPAAKEIDKIIVMMIEAGFVQKVFEDFNYESMKKEDLNIGNREASPLKMKTVIGCFYGLGLLYAICVLVFVAEIVHYKMTSVFK